MDDSTRDNDSKLFRQSIGAIKPIKNDKVSLKKSNSTVNHQTKNLRDPLAKEHNVSTQPINFDDTLAFARQGIQPRQLKRLRQGKIYCEAECDLHGLTQQQAEAYLEDFISEALAQSLRCIRIVHGKGFRSQNGQPVLKNMVNNFLRQLPDVLAFSSAQPKDGGLGAVYVLLRSQR